jgi:hypothetical protein
MDELGIGYMVIGGQAVIEYGHRRHTHDIDIEVTLGPWELVRLRNVAERLQLRPLFAEAFEAAATSLVLPLVSADGSVGIDFALSPSPYSQAGIGRAQRNTIHGYPVAFAAVEDLIIRKIIANRPRDRDDIEQLLLRHGSRIDHVYVDSWLSQFEQVVDQPLRETFHDLVDRSRR